MKFKVGDVVCPKPGTMHLRNYGPFIGEITKTSGYSYNWKVLDAGFGISPVSEKYINVATDASSADEEFELTEVLKSPLYQALL
jgi:hypothetical protein